MERQAEGMPPAPDEAWWAAVLRDADQADEQSPEPVGTPEDWEWAGGLYQHDQRVELQVIGHNRGGLLVEARSLRGFVPVSHLCSFDPNHQEDEKSALLASKLGARLSLKVIEIDPSRGRLVLSQRAALAASGERNRLLECLSPGELVRGVVTNLTPFGAFVDLGGLEGLVHISELSWSRVRHPEDVVECGEEVQAKVLSIDPDQCRVALSLRALQPDPWEHAAEELQVGEVVQGTVTNLVEFGAFVGLHNGLEGLIHVSEFADGQHPQPGTPVTARVINLDPQARRLGLSMRSVSSQSDPQQASGQSRSA